MKVWYVLLISLFPLFLFAQNRLGPRLVGLGNNGTAISDVWSVQQNPAAVQGITQATLSLAYLKHLFSNETSTQAAVAILPFKNNFIAGCFQRYGFSAYQENSVALTYAKAFGARFSLGLNVNYHQLRIEGYGSSNGFSVDVGSYFQLRKELALGFGIKNISRQAYASKQVNLPIPIGFSLGLSYSPNDKVLLAATALKLLNTNVDLSVGLDYQLLQAVSLRGGVSLNPFKQYGGFGIAFKGFCFDMAATCDPNLGYSPQMGVSYAF